MDFNELLARPLPTSTVAVGGFTLPLQALSSKALDDMITRYPPEKGKEGRRGSGHDALRCGARGRAVTRGGA